MGAKPSGEKPRQPLMPINLEGGTEGSMETTLIALYRGRTASDLRLVAASADRSLVHYVSSRLVESRNGEPDPALRSVKAGQRGALKIIAQETA